MPKRYVIILATLFGSILCWSSVPLFLKHFTRDFDPWTVNGIRYGTAALILMPAWITAGRRRGLSGRIIWVDALIPTAINILGQIGWAFAPYYIDASFMGFGIRSAFFFTLLGSLWLLPDERFMLRKPLFWIGSAMCVCGLSLLFAGSLRGEISVTGTLILMATAMVWGFYGISVRKFMRGYSAHHSFGVICLYTAVALGILMAVLGNPAKIVSVPIGTAMMLVVSAAIGIALAHVLMYFSIARVGALVASGFEFMTPFLTFAGAAVLFGERLSPGQWAGGFILISGSLTLLLIHSRRGLIGENK